MPGRVSMPPTPGSDIISTPATEYFNNQGMRTGSSPGGSAGGGSAVVMQSPDGRPFGMFFEPPAKADRRVSGSGVRTISSGSLRRPTRKVSATATATVEETPEIGSSPRGTSPAGSRRQSTLSSGSVEGRRTNGRTGSMSASASNGGIDGLAWKVAASRTPRVPEEGAEGRGQPIYAKGRARGEAPSAKRRAGSTSNSAQPSPSAEVPPKVATPARREKEAAAKKAGKKSDEEDIVVPPINVLIVEDNPINQNILSMFLKKKKIKHQTAKDGEEAVRKWRTGGFHLILMDIQLPVKDGIEATREIRDLERNSNIGVFPMTPASETPPRTDPVLLATSITTTAAPPAISQLKSSVIIVALTASSLQTDRVNALAAGCNDFLTKPVSLKWLEKKIIEWGCMQALIDFDGWRRWKSADPKDPVQETKKGFQTGPLAAAKSLAGRLKINPERKALRQSSTSSSGSTIVPEPISATSSLPPKTPAPVSATSPNNPEIILQSATPTPLDSSDPLQAARAAGQKVAADELAEARDELRGVAPNVIPPLGSNGERSPSLAEVSAGMSSLALGGASEEPLLKSIAEVARAAGEKPLPAIPPE